MDCPLLIDAGPLVAVLDKDDQWHEWAVEAMRRLEPPFATCEAVISEAAFLLQKTRGRGFEGLLHFLESEALTLSFSLDTDREAVAALMRKYADVPMSLADACLVRMAELHPGSQVFTTDEDFRIYRKSNRRVIPLIAPPWEAR